MSREISIGEHVRAWLWVFWVCRISLVGAAAAVIFVRVPQATDLLLDIRQADRLQYWPLFFVAFMLWMAAIYTSARWSVAGASWALRSGERSPVGDTRYRELRSLYKWPTRLVPLAITLAGGAIVVYALHAALGNVPELVGEGGGLVARVEDHLHRTAWLAGLSVAGFLVLVLLAYGRGTGEGAEDNFWPAFLPSLRVEGDCSDDSGRLVRAPQHVSPLFRTMLWAVFGGLTIVLLLLMLRPSLPVLINRAMLAMLLLAVWIPLLTVMARLSHILRFPVVLLLVLTPAVVLQFLGDNHQIHTVAAQLLDPAKADSPTLVRERPSVEAWIERWREANGCGAGERELERCPSPILIAASGGASRAGFFTASVLGRLMDLTCADGVDAACRDARGEETAPALVNQTFAISSISGSTLGATAWVVALERARALALADGAGRPLPCRTEYEPPAGPIGSVTAWFGALFQTLAGELPADSPFLRQVAFQSWHGSYDTGSGRKKAAAGDPNVVSSWQDCMELLVAGDYLSPTISALLTRDPIPVVFPEDRNRVLEDAFDRQMAAVLVPVGAAPESTTRDFLDLYARDIHAIQSGEEAAPGTWLPLLVSNGSSVPYGNRILTSPIAPLQQYDGRSLFRDGTDVYELINPATKKADPCAAAGDLRDVPIRTVVSNSARFPIVSTEGDFPAGGKDCPGRAIGPQFHSERNADQIVDGGYYESSGLTSVFDLATALVANGLRPVVLVLTNDPEVDLSERGRQAFVEESVSGAWGTPLEAILSARAARAYMSLDAIQRLPVPPRGATPPAAVASARTRMAEAAVGADPETAAAAKLESEGSDALPSAQVKMVVPPPSGEADAAALPEARRSLSDDRGSGSDAAAEDMAQRIAFVDVKPVPNMIDGTMCKISLNWWLSHPIQLLLRGLINEPDGNVANLQKMCGFIDDKAAREQCLGALDHAAVDPIVPATRQCRGGKPVPPDEAGSEEAASLSAVRPAHTGRP